jgi:DNA-binding IclR family transcriptional regulator
VKLRDEETARAILSFNAAEGRPPTTLEVAHALGISSKSAGYSRLHALRREGWLVGDDRRVALGPDAMIELATLVLNRSTV